MAFPVEHNFSIAYCIEQNKEKNLCSLLCINRVHYHYYDNFFNYIENVRNANVKETLKKLHYLPIENQLCETGWKLL